MAHRALERPPLVEVLIAAHIDGGPPRSLVELFDFWNQNLREEFPRLTAADLVPEPNETFGAVNWAPPLPQLQLRAEIGDVRLQCMSADETRLVQLQHDRLIMNWRHGSSEYPRFKTLLPEFVALRAMLDSRNAKQGSTPSRVTHWELTYINHIEKGTIWNSPADWPSVVTGLPGWSPTTSDESLETLEGRAFYTINEGGGRLRVFVRHARRGMPDDPDSSRNVEVLEVRLQATGDLRIRKGQSLEEALSVGHDAVVRRFWQVTTEQARRAWGERDDR
jgi:uncharacterized protein (TIGR04255 family)